MKSHEEPLHIAIHAALAHLIRFGLDEGVVTTFGFDRKLECAEWTRVCARFWRRRLLRETNVREELIGRREDVGQCQLATIEMSNQGIAEGRSLMTSCIQSMRSSGRSESRRKRIATAQVPGMTKFSFA
jgi:hypothetical protein